MNNWLNGSKLFSHLSRKLFLGRLSMLWAVWELLLPGNSADYPWPPKLCSRIREHCRPTNLGCYRCRNLNGLIQISNWCRIAKRWQMLLWGCSVATAAKCSWPLISMTISRRSASMESQTVVGWTENWLQDRYSLFQEGLMPDRIIGPSHQLDSKLSLCADQPPCTMGRT